MFKYFPQHCTSHYEIEREYFLEMIVVRSLQDMHEMNAYKSDRVCLSA